MRTEIITLQNSFWSNESPVGIEGGTLLHDDEKQKNYLNLSISYSPDISLQEFVMGIVLLEDNGNPLKTIRYKCKNTNAKKLSFPIDNIDIKSFNFVISGIIKADGTTEEGSFPLIPIKPLVPVSSLEELEPVLWKKLKG